MNAQHLLVVSAVSLFTACGNEGTATSEATVRDREFTEAEGELLGGAIDSAHRFDVGVCAGPLNADGTCGGADCSGTLIAPNLVLTARHCVRAIDYGNTFCDSHFSTSRVGPQTFVTTSDSVRVGTPTWYAVREELLPQGDGLCSDDLALLVLDRQVPAAEARPATVSVFRDVARRSPRTVTIVGRGNVSEVLDLNTFEFTVDRGDALRRILRNIPFECATNDAASPCVVDDFTSPPSNTFASPPGYFVIGSSTAGGDSGSGVFDSRWFDLTFAVWRPAVIGVVSAATYGSDGVPNHSLITRLDGHRGFLFDGFRRAALAAGRPANAFDRQAVSE